MKDIVMKTKEDCKNIITQIGSQASAVGIDAPYTHAIIIDYLQQITSRLDRIEKKLGMEDV